MAITAALVKELRERTGSGMMECKKALVETDGNIEKAVEVLRKSGLAKADKKASRIAAEGRIEVVISPDAKQAIMLEVNSETDFVAKDDNFVTFVNDTATRALEEQTSTIEALNELPYKKDGSKTINEARQEIIAKIGENITLRRIAFIKPKSGILAHYLHGNRIGVMVELEGADAEVGKDVAMHIAASKPVCISESEVPSELIDKEKAIFKAQAEKEGKPENIVEKMIAGRIKKYLAEVTLLGQAFVKNPDITIAALLKEAGGKIISFHRFEVGEGIEKKEENFAQEVMSQVRG